MEAQMICKRCQGTMAKEPIFTLYGEISMLHCINCGEWIDTVVISNRNRSPVYFKEPQSAKARNAAASLWWESVRSKKYLVTS